MPNFDVKDVKQAEGGRLRIDWAEREMPVQAAVGGLFPPIGC